MKILTLSALVCLAILTTANAGDLRIEYSQAGLTQVQVTEWHPSHSTPQVVENGSNRMLFDKGSSLEKKEAHAGTG